MLIKARQGEVLAHTHRAGTVPKVRRARFRAQAWFLFEGYRQINEKLGKHQMKQVKNTK